MSAIPLKGSWTDPGCPVKFLYHHSCETQLQLEAHHLHTQGHDRTHLIWLLDVTNLPEKTAVVSAEVSYGALYSHLYVYQLLRVT